MFEACAECGHMSGQHRWHDTCAVGRCNCRHFQMKSRVHYDLEAWEPSL